MTGTPIASCTWRALDREGEDKCRLVRVDPGWMLIGHAKFHDDIGFAALDYTIRCDAGWHTLSADVAGVHGDLEVRIKIEKSADGWRLNDVLQPAVHAAVDVDMSFTPASNLMPLRRLALSGQPQITLTAAWLRYPQAGLHPLDQTYALSKTAGIISYMAEQTGFATELEVDETGFVTRYPDLWQGEVQHAG